MNSWILAFDQLRIVGKFKVIRDSATYDHPDRIADLQALLEQEAAGMWEMLPAIREWANEILRLLGAAKKEDLEVEDLGYGWIWLWWLYSWHLRLEKPSSLKKLNKGLELNELIWLFLRARCTAITLQQFRVGPGPGPADRRA